MLCVVIFMVVVLSCVALLFFFITCGVFGCVFVMHVSCVCFFVAAFYGAIMIETGMADRSYLIRQFGSEGRALGLVFGGGLFCKMTATACVLQHLRVSIWCQDMLQHMTDTMLNVCVFRTNIFCTAH